MKYFIATDIHGSLYWAKQIKEKYIEERADKLLILGDLYYHGPRNPLPRDYSPMEVCEILNGFGNDITVTRGNCDADIDVTISNFPFVESYSIEICGKKITFAHGDKINANNLPSGNVDFLICGHFHVNKYTQIGSVNCINIASVSLPKDNCLPAYMIIDGNSILIKSFNGETIYSRKF